MEILRMIDYNIGVNENAFKYWKNGLDLLIK